MFVWASARWKGAQKNEETMQVLKCCTKLALLKLNKHTLTNNPRFLEYRIEKVIQDYCTTKCILSSIEIGLIHALYFYYTFLFVYKYVCIPLIVWIGQLSLKWKQIPQYAHLIFRNVLTWEKWVLKPSHNVLLLCLWLKSQYLYWLIWQIVFSTELHHFIALNVCSHSVHHIVIITKKNWFGFSVCCEWNGSERETQTSSAAAEWWLLNRHCYQLSTTSMFAYTWNSNSCTLERETEGAKSKVSWNERGECNVFQAEELYIGWTDVHNCAFVMISATQSSMRVCICVQSVGPQHCNLHIISIWKGRSTCKFTCTLFTLTFATIKQKHCDISIGNNFDRHTQLSMDSENALANAFRWNTIAISSYILKMQSIASFQFIEKTAIKHYICSEVVFSKWMRLFCLTRAQVAFGI